MRQKTPQKGFFMKRMKLIGTIALIAVFGLLIASCGSLDKEIANTDWKYVQDVLGEEYTYTLKLEKKNFSFSVSPSVAGFTASTGNKVETKGDKITVYQDKTEIGSATYKISGSELTLSSPKDIFVAVYAISSKWTK